MEINNKCSRSTSGGRIFRVFFIIFFFVWAGLSPLGAQETDSLKDSTTSSAATSDSGPSLSNLSKSLAAQSEAIAKIKEQERHDQIMSYIWMGLGFSVVIAIAWFTTSLARKRQKKDDEKRALRLAQMKHKPHHHRR